MARAWKECSSDQEFLCATNNEKGAFIDNMSESKASIIKSELSLSSSLSSPPAEAGDDLSTAKDVDTRLEELASYQGYLNRLEEYCSSGKYTTSIGDFVSKHSQLFKTSGDKHRNTTNQNHQCSRMLNQEQPLEHYSIFLKFHDLVEDLLQGFLQQENIESDFLIKICEALKEYDTSAYMSMDHLLSSTEYEHFLQMFHDFTSMQEWDDDAADDDQKYLDFTMDMDADSKWPTSSRDSKCPIEENSDGSSFKGCSGFVDDDVDRDERFDSKMTAIDDDHSKINNHDRKIIINDSIVQRDCKHLADDFSNSISICDESKSNNDQFPGRAHK